MLVPALHHATASAVAGQHGTRHTMPVPDGASDDSGVFSGETRHRNNQPYTRQHCMRAPVKAAFSTHAGAGGVLQGKCVFLRQSPAPRPPAFVHAALHAAAEDDCDDSGIVLRRSSPPRPLAFDQSALNEAAG